MSFRCKTRLLFVFLLGLCALPFSNAQAADSKRVLRIAADPNNLPFSNNRLEGFENKIAELIADELHAEIEWIWHAQRRGFFRQTLKEGDADLVMGVPAGFERALTTKPYYRSTYVFVTRRGEKESINSLDDPQLRTARIGVHLIGDDGINTPPVHALTERNIITNVVGYTLYGDYKRDNPPAAVVEAVANKDVDVAIIWGPLAGYFASQSPVGLEVTPIPSNENTPNFKFAWDISIGVKKKNSGLRDEIDSILSKRKSEIQTILAGFHIPMVPPVKETGGEAK